jgi:glycosyltransferase involved in cell wall biosynthesis
VTPARDPIQLVRIIARLNIGGPAIQAITLTKLLEPRGYATRLVRGVEGPDEGNMDYLADALGVAPTKVASLVRDPDPNDLRALAAVIRILRRDRPQVVHTHAAKAGTIGRVATLLAFPRRRDRPLLVHTFHGHSLTGYFSSRTARLFLAVERCLARRTDVLIAVSPEVRDDLVRLGVASAERFVVVPLGFDLGPFADDANRAARRDAVRAAWGVGPDHELVTLVARLVPIKRVDRFLRVAELIGRDRPQARFVVVGDGELQQKLQTSPAARSLSDRLVWAGFRRDMPEVYFASDVVMLTSDNEGTPVSLIEAQAAAVPVVGTDVGGVRSAVREHESGVIVAPDDERGLAQAVSSILDDPELARRMGAAGRDMTTRAFEQEKLVQKLDKLYRSGMRGGSTGDPAWFCASAKFRRNLR